MSCFSQHILASYDSVLAAAMRPCQCGPRVKSFFIWHAGPVARRLRKLHYRMSVTRLDSD